MPSFLQTALAFLSQTLFTLWIALLLLRICLQLTGANARNPLTQLLIQLTRPILKPMQKFLPTYGRADLALLVLCLVSEMLKMFVYGWIKGAGLLDPLAVFLYSMAELLQFTLHLYSMAIVVQAILTWINPRPNPLNDLLYTLTAPLLNLARRFIPPIGGFDLSPIPVLIVLQLLMLLVTVPILGFATQMM